MSHAAQQVASAPTDAARAPTLGALDGLGAALLCGALCALYWATLQQRQFGDGAPLTQYFIRSIDSANVWPHVLYMPVGRLLHGLLGSQSPVQTLRLLSCLGGAVGGGCLFLVARAFGASRPGALCASLLLALCPGWWFFSTTVEVVALHAGCVALCAAVTLLAPWRRPLLAAVITATFIPLLFLSHQSGLFLGPGFVLLAQFARERSTGTRFSARALIFGVGPLFLAGFLFAIALSARLRHVSLPELFEANAEFVAGYGEGFTLENLYRLWIAPLGALLPLAVAAVALRHTRGLALAAVAGLILPSLVFYSVWGLHERGAYALPSACFLAAAAGPLLSVRGRGRSLAVALLVGLQGLAGHASLAAWDAPQWGAENAERARAVRAALGERGSLFSINVRFQEIESELPQVTEINLFPALRSASDEGVTPAQFAVELEARIAGALAAGGGPVVLDLSARPTLALGSAKLLPYLDALEVQLAAGHRVTRFDDPHWPMLRIE